MPVVIFSALGRILARGGTRTAARLIRSGLTGNRLKERILGRFPGIFSREANVIARIAGKGVLAADAIFSGIFGERVPESAIPINPMLFGDKPLGNRFKYDTTWTVPETGKSVRVILDDPDNLTKQQIIEQIREQAEFIVGKYPEKFGLAADEEFELDLTEITIVERST